MTKYISPGTLAIAVIAIVVGLGGAYAVRSLLSSPAPAAQAPQQTQGTIVPLASADLPEGRIIRLGDISLVRMTGEEMRKQKMPLESVMLSSDQIIGRRLLEPQIKGQPFLTTSVYLQGNGPEVAEMLKPGYRAVTIQVREQQGGWVAAGAFVDVVFRSKAIPGQGDKRDIPETTMTLIEHAEVLNVVRPRVTALQAVTGYVAIAPMITLAVTPEQANILQMVQDRGDLSLLVSQPDKNVDTATALDRRRLTLEELLGVEAETDPDTEEEDKPFTTEIYRRGARSINTFEREQLTRQVQADDPPLPTVMTSDPDDATQ